MNIPMNAQVPDSWLSALTGSASEDMEGALYNTNELSMKKLVDKMAFTR